MEKIQLEHLTKNFGEVVAVNDLNLIVRDKEFIVLLGPSGCGKTTTLRLIAGLELPTEGKVIMNGEDITHVHPKDRKMSMVFQSYALYPHMSALDNISFPLKIKKLQSREIQIKVRKVAELLNIEDLLQRKPKELSGGEKQRVALGRAIVKEPEVFLMDEPLSNLDAKLRVFVRGELKSLQKKLGITTIYVTHDQVEAMSMADRIAVMDRGGKLQQISSPDELFNNPTTPFVAGFIGSHPMNLIDCSLIQKNGRAFLDAGEFTIDVSDLRDVLKTTATGSELVLGVRPENINILQGKAKANGDFIASIHTIEPLGLEAIATVRKGDKLLRIKVSNDFRGSVGEEVGISLSRQEMYIFDAKTGKRCK
ncbi:MAG: ABC transporter ATP-binding protein [Candidatus Heimdallarchaeota archaeon]